MLESVDDLFRASIDEDLDRMHSATLRLRTGLKQFESALATTRAIEQGASPRNEALRWFKSELHLLPPVGQERKTLIFGMSPFHLTICSVLVIFMILMLWMYVHKMKKAASLLQTLQNVPPPSPKTQTLERASAHQEVATPRSGKWSGQLKVGSIFSETPNVKTFRFVSPDESPLPFAYLPGQFLTLSLKPDDKVVKRSYTISSSPTQRYYCEITVKREEHGLVSKYLCDHLTEGGTLDISAPGGRLTFTGKEADSIVLLAGGVGITPMMSVIRYLTDIGWPKDIYLFYSCRHPEEFIFREELEYLQARHPKLHVLVTMTKAKKEEWPGPRERLNKTLLSEFIPDISSKRVHICGSVPMTAAAKSILSELGLPKEQVKSESFGGQKKKGTQAQTEERQEPTEVTQAPKEGVPQVTFQKSKKSVDLPHDKCILEVAEENGVDIDYTCREGTCGDCIVKILSGEVNMECEDGLDPEEKAQGFALACQAKSTKDVVVDA